MLTERSSAAGQGSQAPPRSRLAAWTSQAGRLPDADHTSPGAPAGHVRRRRARSRGALSAGHPLAGHGAALHTGAKLNAENVRRPAEMVAGKKAEQPHTQGCAFQEGVSAEPRRIRARQADYRRRCRVLSSPVQWFFEPLHGFTPRWGQALRVGLSASRTGVGAAATVSSVLEPACGSRSPRRRLSTMDTVASSASSTSSRSTRTRCSSGRRSSRARGTDARSIRASASACNAWSLLESTVYGSRRPSPPGTRCRRACRHVRVRRRTPRRRRRVPPARGRSRRCCRALRRPLRRFFHDGN
jgi:hypothetical protein